MSRCLLSCLMTAALALLLGCGGGGGDGAASAPNVPITSMAMAPLSTTLSAGQSQQFTATLAGPSDLAVVWQVNGVAGGSPSTGTISATGVYTSPATVSATTAFTITAVAHADASKSANSKATVFATPRVGVRRNTSGAMEFFDRSGGTTFQPRGNCYVHWSYPMSSILWGGIGWAQSTLNTNFYDPVKVEAALTRMQSSGFNTVKIWMNWDAVGDVGNPAGPGLDPKYLGNLADFLTRAKAHNLLAILTYERLPPQGGYVEALSQVPAGQFGDFNTQFMTQAGLDSTTKFWKDLILGLVVANAPMDDILGYQVAEEFWAPPDQPPVSLRSGLITTANGKTYDMADSAARDAIRNESMVYWCDQLRTGIQSIAPGSLVGIGFATPVLLSPFPDIGTSTVDFLAFSASPSPWRKTFAEGMAGLPLPGYKNKPIMMGEYWALMSLYSTTGEAAAALEAWQITSCGFGFSGWLYWVYDAAGDELTWTGPYNTPGWSEVAGDGEIDYALGPLHRPDPSQPLASPMPIRVEVLPGSAYVQAGAALLLQGIAHGSALGVDWSINGIPGGNATVGTISSGGTYIAPTGPTLPRTVSVTATAQGDVTRSATAQLTLFAAPPIGVRRNPQGTPQFYDRSTGVPFVPRGNCYVRYSEQLLLISDPSQKIWGHATFNTSLYDATRAEAALAQMEALGYNTVKVWLAGQSLGDIGNPSGPGLDPLYLASVADFLNRAKAHHLLVTLTCDQLPWQGGYNEIMSQGVSGDTFAHFNAEYMPQAGIDGGRKFWQDLIQGLVAANAPMDAIFAFQLREGLFFAQDFQPLSLTSGLVYASTGKTYDMRFPEQRSALQTECLVNWANGLCEGIKALSPSALVSVGFFNPNFTPDGRQVPVFPAIGASELDFIDLHCGPEWNTSGTLALDLQDWGLTSFQDKPIIMGQFAAPIGLPPTAAEAATALSAWQAQGCALGFSGWVLYNWDADATEQKYSNLWAAKDESGVIATALSPQAKPDPGTY